MKVGPMDDERDQTSSLGTRIGVYFGWSEVPDRPIKGRQKWRPVLLVSFLFVTAGSLLTAFVSSTWGNPVIAGGMAVLLVRLFQWCRRRACPL
jgi:hypothetical protein